MNRAIEEYMSLPYTIEITPDEGSYFVKIKELPTITSKPQEGEHEKSTDHYLCQTGGSRDDPAHQAQ